MVTRSDGGLKASRRGLGRWRIAVQLAIGLLVTAFIVQAVVEARRQLAREAAGWPQPDLRWLAVAALAYLAGMLPMGAFWHRLLAAVGVEVGWRQALTAYYVGHLGKYVPGKAMVVVLRVGLLRAEGAGRLALAVTVVAETMTMMSVGACLAAILLIGQAAERPGILLLAVGLAVVSAIPTCPWVLRKLVGWTQRRRADPEAVQSAVRHLDGRLLAGGWLANVAGWLLLGVSLAAVAQGLAPDVPLVLRAGQLPAMIATAGLAVVAGFLSLLPGGVGVREWVVTQLLSGPVGPAGALAAAVLLRLVWLAAECLAAAALLAIDRLLRWEAAAEPHGKGAE